jgi:hypothetical protein
LSVKAPRLSEAAGLILAVERLAYGAVLEEAVEETISTDRLDGLTVAHDRKVHQ